jgi:hypothetical protein
MQYERDIKSSRNTPTAHMIPPTIWTDISMDFIVGLPKSKNKLVVMVVVHHISKYDHFCALQHPFTTSIVAQFFMDNIFKLHGMLHSFVFYHDPTFTNTFWKELFGLQGTQLHLIIGYHIQTDRQTKAVNKCLETYLRCFSSDRQNQWVQWLPLTEWWCNIPNIKSMQNINKILEMAE